MPKKCFFKKNNDNNDDKLLLFCDADYSGTFSLGKINSMNLNTINIFYNFNMEETINNQISTISEEEGPKVYFVYPTELNFDIEDSYMINYEVDNEEKLIGLKLNNNANDELKCIYTYGIKKCTIPKTHFDKSGYYYTSYTNNFNSSVILYEIEKIKIILTNNNGPDGGDNNDPDSETNLVGIIAGSVAGGIVLIGIIIFFIWRYKRKNSDYDFSKSANILPNSKQIELKNDNECEEED